MFEKDKKFSLKKYQKQRKGKVSVFGISAEFDWLILNVFVLILIFAVFVISIREINQVLTYEPEADTEYQLIFKDDKVVKNLDKIIESFTKEEIIETNLETKNVLIDETASE